MRYETRLDVLGFMIANSLSLTSGVTVRQTKDKQSIVLNLSSGAIITVVDIDNNKKFLCSMTSHVSVAVTVDYDDFFKDIQLPAEEPTLLRVLLNRDADAESSFTGYLFKKLSDVAELQTAIESENLCGHHAKYKDFYKEVIVSAFEKYKRTNKVDLSEKDRDTFIKAMDPEIAGIKMFPQQPTTSETGSSSTDVRKSNTSKPLPEELPKFDDEYELQRHKQTERYLPHKPFAPIGDRDLDPFGKYPSLKPFLGGVESSPHSGMIPDKHHPLFHRGSTPDSGRDDHPPGARYDDPLGQGDFDGIGKGLPGGLGSGREGGSGSFGGDNPFGRSSGFGGGFI